MEILAITCSRCRKAKKGAQDGLLTVGFFKVGEGFTWAKYARPGEMYLCDSCMWADPMYQTDYVYTAPWAKTETSSQTHFKTNVLTANMMKTNVTPSVAAAELPDQVPNEGRECLICGRPTENPQCKERCMNCGFQSDCSDP